MKKQIITTLFLFLILLSSCSDNEQVTNEITNGNSISEVGISDNTPGNETENEVNVSPAETTLMNADIELASYTEADLTYTCLKMSYSKEKLKNTTQEDFKAFIKSRVEESNLNVYNCFTIYFEDETGICFLNCSGDYIYYCIPNEYGMPVNIMGVAGLTENNDYLFLKMQALPDGTMHAYPENGEPLTVYEEGQYKVGVDMPAGCYMLYHTNEYAGYFMYSSDANGNDIIQNENFDNNSIIEVYNGEYLTLKRCYAVPLESAPKLGTTDGFYSDGFYIVGVHIPAGEYKIESTDPDVPAYYCLYNDLRREDIDSNDNFNGSRYINISEGQYLEIKRCKIYID